MKILCCSDSFTTDFGHAESWISMLTKTHAVENLSQAGISEYKILNQLKTKLKVLDDYDLIIISHTSPNRVHINKHPVHKTKVTHQNSDLLFSDVEYHLGKNSQDPVLQAAYGYFMHIFDPEYYQDIFYLIQKEIGDIIGNRPSLHITNFSTPNAQGFQDYINLPEMLHLESGNINHYNVQSNQKIFEYVSEYIGIFNERN